MACTAAANFFGFVSIALALGCARQAPEPTSSHASPRAVASSPAPSPAPARPHLRVGTSGDYAPFSVRDASGKVRGFDIEIAEGFADDLGFELEWVSFRWPTLKSQLQDGEFDVAMGGVTWQPARGVLG